MSKKWKIGLGVVAGLLVIGAIGSAMEDEEKDEAAVATPEPASNGQAQEPEPGKAEEAEKPEPEPEPAKDEKPKFDKKAYAAELEQAFIDASWQEPREMCDTYYTHWGCFYDGIEAERESLARVFLNTDGGWSKDDLKELSKDAARHWFNAVGSTYEKLDVIVVQTNGIDRNYYRRDVPILNR